ILLADKDTLYGKNLPSNEIVSKLKGEIGSEVNLKVYRKKDDEFFTVTINRDHVPIKSVESFYMLTSEMGYIKINRFAESTFKEFKNALRSLQRNGATRLTLDLRDNPGGYLGIAEQMADEFLEDEKLILFTKNKKGKIDSLFATQRGSFEDKPVFVLINERSASASEIIAGALQDNDIGTIVGRRSFGKGLVQREMELGDGSAVRLTVARYYTPTGRSIQRTYENGNEDYYQKFTDRYHNGELMSVDSIKVADSLKYTPPKGNIVYGGGGIIPDVFVPIGNMAEETIESMDGLGFISRFVFEHLEEDRKQYESYTQPDFVKEFRVDDILFEKFVNFAIDNKIRMNYYDNDKKIKRYLKAAIAEQLFSANIAAKIKGASDPMLQKVLDLDLPSIQQTNPKNKGLLKD
ncbi:MAG: peptidase S41, partial [Muriicola sp.]|nr:peptidase S41 [Muriicola sp.]